MSPKTALRLAREAPRGLRVNVVSSPWVTETRNALNMDPEPWQTRGRGGEGLR